MQQDKKIVDFIEQQLVVSGNKFRVVSKLERQLSKLEESIGFLIENIKEVICYNQKIIAEFSIKTANYVNQILQVEDIEDLEKMIVNFYNMAQEDITSSCKVSVNYLYKYFQLDGRHMPRITIKLLRQKDKHIIDYYRGDRNSYLGYAFPAEQHTGFDEVNKGDKYYCCNNIPEKAKSNLYKNNRLIRRLVEKYALPVSANPDCKYFSHDKLDSMRDLEWEKCWHDYGKKQKPPMRSCYKSTLVVPIILSEVNIDTKSRLMIDDKYVSAIFGYICFDDVCVDYFQLPRDQYIGYIFSDILSLYIVALNYFERGVLREKISQLDKEKHDWRNRIWHSELRGAI